MWNVKSAKGRNVVAGIEALLFIQVLVLEIAAEIGEFHQQEIIDVGVIKGLSPIETFISRILLRWADPALVFF